jgi:hypothetical protein
MSQSIHDLSIRRTSGKPIEFGTKVRGQGETALGGTHFQRTHGCFRDIPYLNQGHRPIV